MDVVLVTGATGRQGGAVARALLARGIAVRALTRRPEGAAAQALAALGAGIAPGDLDRPETLGPALRGVGGVFSVQNFWEKGVGHDGEVRQGRALIDAARAAGVGHVVQSAIATQPGGVPAEVRHFASKAAIEAHLAASGLPHTVLGLPFYMDNAVDPRMAPLMFPLLAGTLGEGRIHPLVAVEDVGAAAAAVFADPAAFRGERLDLAGDLLTVGQMREAHRRALGRAPKGWRLPNVATRLLAADFAAQLRWQRRVPWAVSPDTLRALVPGALTWEGYLRRHAPPRL